jgi:tetratricopeptide (TPR) repeat protein
VFRSTVLLACFVLMVAGSAVRAADYSEQLLPIMQLVQDKKYSEAIAGYEKFLQQAPQSLQSSVQFEIASLHAAMGNKASALEMMEQAIRAGFDDCLAVRQYEEWKSFSTDPRFNELCSRIRVSEADSKELYWLKAEIESVHHDTKMMITENINRVDNGITAVPQSAIPIRETASPGVLFNREVLKVQQRVQKQYVFLADKARIQHLTRMTIISGGASAEQVALSSRFAGRMAEERTRAINARKFSVPAGAGTTPRPCADWK